MGKSKKKRARRHRVRPYLAKPYETVCSTLTDGEVQRVREILGTAMAVREDPYVHAHTWKASNHENNNVKNKNDHIQSKGKGHQEEGGSGEGTADGVGGGPKKKHRKKKKKKKKKKNENKIGKEEMRLRKGGHPSSPPLFLRRYCCLGVNEVTRALERRPPGLSSLLLAGADPRLVSHLPIMATRASIPVASSGHMLSSQGLGSLVGLKKVAALGIRSNFDRNERGRADQGEGGGPGEESAKGGEGGGGDRKGKGTIGGPVAWEQALVIFGPLCEIIRRRAEANHSFQPRGNGIGQDCFLHQSQKVIQPPLPPSSSTTTTTTRHDDNHDDDDDDFGNNDYNNSNNNDDNNDDIDKSKKAKKEELLLPPSPSRKSLKTEGKRKRGEGKGEKVEKWDGKKKGHYIPACVVLKEDGVKDAAKKERKRRKKKVKKQKQRKASGR